MRRATPLLLAAMLLAAVPAAAATPRSAVQSIGLDATAPDGSVGGVARLTAVKEQNGFRIRGYVESIRGCVELRAVNMHWASYLGGDPITKACESNVQVGVSAWTHHTDIVLSAIVPHGPDWDSSIVTLTGR